MKSSHNHIGHRLPGSVTQTILALLLSALLVIVSNPGLHTAAGAANNHLDIVNEVRGERIMSTVIDLQDFNSRAFFANSTLNASEYIRDRFAELGLWVTLQDFTVKGYLQRNVIAVLNGTDPAAPQFLFGAHYDDMTSALIDYGNGSSDYAPGANDDASGVAAAIELATVLHDMTFNATVKFVAFAAEETGLNGSDSFVQKELVDGVLYSGTAIMDMIGYRSTEKNEVFIFRDNPLNVFAGQLQSAVYAYGLDLSLTFVSGTEFGYSDHYRFWNAGYPSFLVIEKIAEGRPVDPNYHTVNDTANKLSQDQMKVVTQALLGGFLELQDPHESKKTDAFLVTALVIIASAAIIILALYAIRKRKGIE